MFCGLWWLWLPGSDIEAMKVPGYLLGSHQRASSMLHTQFSFLSISFPSYNCRVRHITLVVLAFVSPWLIYTIVDPVGISIVFSQNICPTSLSSTHDITLTSFR